LKTKDLIKNCIDNNTIAQREFYDLFAPKMLSICHRYAESASDAEDIFQEGFMRVFENLHQVKDEKALEWWMKRIFINEALKLYNKNKRISLVEDLSLIKPVQAYEHNVLDKLGTDVFNMYAIEGFSHKEISEIMNISEGTSKSNLHDARKILQRKISALEKIKLLG
jgi:RNA polymerase sigma-70 factor (ECF subfamily)